MATMIYDGDATIRYGTALVIKGVPFNVAEGDVQPLRARYGCRLVNEPAADSDGDTSGTVTDEDKEL